MTKPFIAPADVTDLLKETWQAVNANPMVAPQVEHFWDAQDNILKESETFTKHWFARRHTAARTALQTVRTVSETGSSDPAKALSAIADWQAKSMERMVEDVREWFDLCSRCAAHLSRAEIEAGEEGIEKAAQATASKRRPKDDVPL